MRFFPHTHERFRFAILTSLFGLLMGVHAAVSNASTPMSADVARVRVGDQRTAVSVRETRTSLPGNMQDFSKAIEERRTLLTRSVHVEFTAEKDGATVTLSSWLVEMKVHPLWIVFDTSDSGGPTAVISPVRIAQYIANERPFSFPSPRECDLLSSWTDDYGVQRAQTTCIAQSGYIYDKEALVQSLRTALEQGETTVRFPLTYVPGKVRDASGTLGTDEIQLLSTGRSTFVGSGVGRKLNVRKALNEHVHNVLVPEGAVYSFNKVLGPAVSQRNGWAMALTIFEGANLRPAPGGGICQTSTTVFRAAVRAGLPILEQKNHSLYVTYYEKFGVGLDATVFPGKQDMEFANNTGGPLLIQSYNEGDEAYVNIFGKDDGRSVLLTGPYFTDTAPVGEKVGGNSILWKRTVQIPGQEVQADSFLARYKAISWSLSKKWPAVAEQTRGIPLHAAAKEVAETK